MHRNWRACCRCSVRPHTSPCVGRCPEALVRGGPCAPPALPRCQAPTLARLSAFALSNLPESLCARASRMPVMLTVFALLTVLFGRVPRCFLDGCGTCNVISRLALRGFIPGRPSSVPVLTLLVLHMRSGSRDGASRWNACPGPAIKCRGCQSHAGVRDCHPRHVIPGCWCASSVSLQLEQDVAPLWPGSCNRCGLYKGLFCAVCQGYLLETNHWQL